MRILYHSRTPPDARLAEAVEAQPRGLEALLRESDALAVCLSLNPGTQGLIGARELALMKPGAWLVNLARGGIVDEAALADALDGGCLAGAGVDVFAEEPVRPDNPLL